MTKNEFIKIILKIGIIDKNSYLTGLALLEGCLCNKSFLMTLQEIDSSVFKYYPTMDIDETVILDNCIIFFNYQDCIDLNEQRSIFMASNPNHLIIAKIHTLKKLDYFFIKPRFKNRSFDIDLKINIREFINKFVESKLNLLIQNFN